MGSKEATDYAWLSLKAVTVTSDEKSHGNHLLFTLGVSAFQKSKKIQEREEPHRTWEQRKLLRLKAYSHLILEATEHRVQNSDCRKPCQGPHETSKRLHSLYGNSRDWSKKQWQHKALLCRMKAEYMSSRQSSYYVLDALCYWTKELQSKVDGFWLGR